MESGQPGLPLTLAINVSQKTDCGTVPLSGGNETHEFTSQFFFDEAFTDAIYRDTATYGTRTRDTLSSTDGIYSGASSTSNSGSNLMLALRNKPSWGESDAKLICDSSLRSSPDQVPGGLSGPSHYNLPAR